MTTPPKRMTGLSSDRVAKALCIVLNQGRGENRLLRIPRDYMVPNVSQKVLRVIISYVDYIRRTVWFE